MFRRCLGSTVAAVISIPGAFRPMTSAVVPLHLRVMVTHRRFTSTAATTPAAAAASTAVGGGCPEGMVPLATPQSSAKVDELASVYCQLTLKEITELQRLIFKKLGHSDSFYEQALLRGLGGGGGGGGTAASAPASDAAGAVAAGGASPAAAPPKPKAAPAAPAEKAAYDVHLKAYPPENKAKIIKEVKTATNMSLGDAKGMVDKAPGIVAKNLPKEDANKLKKLLEEHKAEVDLI